MKKIRLPFIFLFVLGLVGAFADHHGEKGFIKLFNGKNFEGWSGDVRWFRIEEGAIVAGTLKEKSIVGNRFLSTIKEYYDFELKAKVKLRPMYSDKKCNGGIQFRSIPWEGKHGMHEMYGFQADIGTGVWGTLYDESRRRKFLNPEYEGWSFGETPPLLSKLNKIVKVGDWNDYRLRVKGDHIQIWVNGHKITDYIEKDHEIVKATGKIALQIHSASYPQEILYRDIYLKEL